MPTPYINKMAKKHGISVDAAEKKWDEAKNAAKKQGQEGNYAYITKIFQSMVGEKASVEALLATALTQELAASDAKDVVSLDVPLLTRVMEICREDIKTDADLHRLLEKIIEASKDHEVLTMDQYDSLSL